MTTRYQEKHYEDVARILSLRRAPKAGGKLGHILNVGLAGVAVGFADLFAADNGPPLCTYCGDAKGTTAICTKVEHNFKGGFDREQFLEACGLESEG